MVKLSVISKGNRYTVTDQKDRMIYTVKSGIGGKTHLINSGGYKLYYFQSDRKSKKPAFNVFHDDARMFRAECTSMFLDPGFELRGEKLSIDVVSQDRLKFRIMDSGNQIGEISLQSEDKKEARYLIEIDENYFDDYIPLIAVFIDTAFGRINREITGTEATK